MAESNLIQLTEDPMPEPEQLSVLAPCLMSPDPAMQALAIEILKPYYPIVEYTARIREMEYKVVSPAKKRPDEAFFYRKTENWLGILPARSEFSSFFKHDSDVYDKSRYMDLCFPGPEAEYVFDDANILSHCWVGSPFEYKISGNRLLFRQRRASCYLYPDDAYEHDYSLTIKFLSIGFPSTSALPLSEDEKAKILSGKLKIVVGTPDLSTVIVYSETSTRGKLPHKKGENLFDYGTSYRKAVRDAVYYHWKSDNNETYQVTLRNSANPMEPESFQRLIYSTL